MKSNIMHQVSQKRRYHTTLGFIKRTMLLITVCMAAFITRTKAQETATTERLAKTLNLYYDIKNALVNGDGKSAATGARYFIKNLNGISYKYITEENVSILLKDATGIAKAKDIARQREYFANFSINMQQLAKALKLTDQPVYIQYCPMKKAYWLSSQKAIRNPYYGDAMLTCGNVTETIE